MDSKNLLTIIKANIHMNYRCTVLPAILVLLAIPSVYGTANLDYLKSADCLERMAALIGIPMFAGLVQQENAYRLYEIVGLKPVPFRFIVMIRMGISAIWTLLLIFTFEFYMRISGCSFPFFSYAFRTLAVSAVLGSAGLLLASAARNTIVGYLGSLFLYIVVSL